MLIKYVSFFASLLISVSCASTSDDGAEVTVAGEVLIKEALNTPKISSQLTSSSHAILSSIASKNDFTMPFYDFAIQNYNFNCFGFDSEDPQRWNDYINNIFREFSSQQPDQAQIIMNKIVLPNHPFLSQVPFTFKTADFLGPDIDVFLDKVAYNIFIQQFSQLLALKDTSEAKILLKDLLYKAKNTSRPDPEFKYHHAYIANAPFDYLKRTKHRHSENLNSINAFISQLAPFLYNEVAEHCKYLADEMLYELLPSIYSTLTDTSYENTIRKYQESSLQPIDKSYLWDPQEFHGDFLEAFQVLLNFEIFTLPYFKILKLLSSDSPLVHLFRHYIAQNYFKPSYLSPRHQLLFWRSLIFSSFSEFSSILRHRSKQILSLDEVEHLFVYGILDNQFSYEDKFVLVSGWGHTFTAKVLLRHRTSSHWTYIYDDYIRKAFLDASKRGHLSFVKILLHIPTDTAGEALAYAALGGHTSVVELLLQSRTDISADHIGRSLCNAAYGGHTFTVKLLLQLRFSILVAHFGLALENASQAGHTGIIELIRPNQLNMNR
jgi:hypothetical protein